MHVSSAFFPDPLVPVLPVAEPEVSASQQPVLDADAALMLEVAAGSEQAFVELVQRHQSPLLNFFARMGVSSDGEDLVQETFVRLFRSRRQYRPTAKFTTFLYVLARHVWADRGRRVVRIERLASHLETEMEIASQAVRPGASESIDVGAALARLSPKLREVIVLNIYQGMRYQEVADVLRIPLGTVKSRLNLALRALREIVDAR
jgi:RNA polymerase sigma-70 factor (ECF subfamily)